MKKAIKINLSGIIFHIDDDAYEKLKSYLDTISRHFSNKQESKEIIDDIESRIAELAEKARKFRLSIEEMTGGTFTITNGGVFGSMLSTPIINPPQAAILGMHNIVERPVAIHGKVEIRPVMYLALSYDHRLVDGRDSVSFLVKVKELLEDPYKMLLGGQDPEKVLLGL